METLRVTQILGGAGPNKNGRFSGIMFLGSESQLQNSHAVLNKNVKESVPESLDLETLQNYRLLNQKNPSESLTFSAI